MSDTPALFDHCDTIYSAMLEQATEHESGKLYIWKGFLTKLFEEVGFGVPRYTRITNMMQQMGCIEQVERGAGTKPSVWYMHKAPTLKDFEYAKERMLATGGRTKAPNIVEQRLNDLNKAFLDLHERLSAVEQIIRTEVLGESSDGETE